MLTLLHWQPYGNLMLTLPHSYADLTPLATLCPLWTYSTGNLMALLCWPYLTLML